MRILLTGGGTGGHIYPALAICKYFKNRDKKHEFLFVGTQKGLESKIVPDEGIPFATITVEGLSRKMSFQTLKSGLKLSKGIIESLLIIKKFKPDIVIGTGGYVCGPVVLVASLLKIPTLIHEQNAYPGITNKILSKFVDTVCLTFEESKKYFTKTKNDPVITGLPIRQEILKVSKDEGLKQLSLKDDRFTIVVVGGSRGAYSINKAVLQLIDKVAESPQTQLLLITGQAGYEEVMAEVSARGGDHQQKDNLIIKPYLKDMEYALAVADLVVCRSGATFLAEITAKGIPAILVPYPHASENHQEFNAKALVSKEAALMILDRELTGKTLLDNIDELQANKEALKNMELKSRELGQRDAIEKIATAIDKLVSQKTIKK